MIRGLKAVMGPVGSRGAGQGKGVEARKQQDTGGRTWYPQLGWRREGVHKVGPCYGASGALRCGHRLPGSWSASQRGVELGRAGLDTRRGTPTAGRIPEVGLGCSCPWLTQDHQWLPWLRRPSPATLGTVTQAFGSVRTLQRVSEPGGRGAASGRPPPSLDGGAGGRRACARLCTVGLVSVAEGHSCSCSGLP